MFYDLFIMKSSLARELADAQSLFIIQLSTVLGLKKIEEIDTVVPPLSFWQHMA